MDIILENITLPEKGRVEIVLPRAFEIKVTAEEARRMVNRWLLNEVSYLMGAEPPTLVVGERVVWRVPAYISYPHVGKAGTVGAVDVDVETGVMNNSPELIGKMHEHAKKIHAKLPPYEPKRETPAEYLSKDVPPARKLILAEDGQVKPAPVEESR